MLTPIRLDEFDSFKLPEIMMLIYDASVEWDAEDFHSLVSRRLAAGFSVDERTSFKYSAAYLAASYGMEGALRILLGFGADPGVGIQDMSGFPRSLATPLTVGAATGTDGKAFGICSMLLDAGAPMDGWAFRHCLRRNLPETAKLLASRGADLFEGCREGGEDLLLDDCHNGRMRALLGDLRACELAGREREEMLSIVAEPASCPMRAQEARSRRL